MSIDPDLAAEWAVDNALDADPFAGDDPPADWLPEPLPGETPAVVADTRNTYGPFTSEAPF